MPIFRKIRFCQCLFFVIWVVHSSYSQLLWQQSCTVRAVQRHEDMAFLVRILRLEGVLWVKQTMSRTKAILEVICRTVIWLEFVCLCPATNLVSFSFRMNWQRNKLLSLSKLAILAITRTRIMQSTFSTTTWDCPWDSSSVSIYFELNIVWWVKPKNVAHTLSCKMLTMLCTFSTRAWELPPDLYCFSLATRYCQPNNHK